MRGAGAIQGTLDAMRPGRLEFRELLRSLKEKKSRHQHHRRRGRLHDQHEETPGAEYCSTGSGGILLRGGLPCRVRDEL